MSYLWVSGVPPKNEASPVLGYLLVLREIVFEGWLHFWRGKVWVLWGIVFDGVGADAKKYRQALNPTDNPLCGTDNSKRLACIFLGNFLGIYFFCAKFKWC